MEYFQIRGAGPLRGETAVSGAKNAALPILAACVLCRGPCVLYNCPEIADVETTLAILRALGAKAERYGAAAADRMRTFGRTRCRFGSKNRKNRDNI